MSRPTVTVISAKGESTKDTITVPNVFKVSRQRPQCAVRDSAICPHDTSNENIRPSVAKLEDGWIATAIADLHTEYWLTKSAGAHPP
ncbi:hypothetical protein FB567DRAFT_97596 [Paraphoma chrysanthemicola]|uniref:Uncharacterized protein n=1 Tax=Paraphoma chrysanthemicola TaxID=798071 RepID=A0A8K0R157_9PLEO|nr:hypothetical protein FB567DRAFT_97596 [Paraphoma chrysanthemicola]